MATTTQNLQKELKKTTTDAVTLARSTAGKVQKDVNDTVGDVRDSVQNVFLAGLGALALAEEEGSKLFKNLVQKGEKVDLPSLGVDRLKAVRDDLEGRAGKATGLVKGRAASAKDAADDTADKAEDRLQETVATVMKRLGVPTRDEVGELSASVERLTDHIERLKTSQVSAEPVTPAAPVTAARAAASAAPSVQADASMQAVGGGWYEIRVGEVVVEKVQGRGDAEAALVRVQEQRA
ncbi:phasin family protein [Rubrivirga sp. S365]|uniref:phasin family protein n=1 Tax=Rubrivirga sp. S365 TaxID=3076080 RepID=UPI0028C6BF20|nr:phasin family protein [Rubrivirga sp. S365]MDT7857115.1 phasin family protein [Rubrivirga sp. S365]